MSMPGFTADAAVHSLRESYRMVSRPEQSFDGVQAAQAFDLGGAQSLDLDKPWISTSKH